MADTRPETVILDIDGTLLHHYGSLASQMLNEPKLLPDVTDKLHAWDRRGCKIILLTGRRESIRELTVRQLESLGIIYDVLIMGVGGGRRVLVNDCKPDGEDTALAFTVPRNQGLSDVNF